MNDYSLIKRDDSNRILIELFRPHKKPSSLLFLYRKPVKTGDIEMYPSLYDHPHVGSCILKDKDILLERTVCEPHLQ
jgi:hypothetical protein